MFRLRLILPALFVASVALAQDTPRPQTAPEGPKPTAQPRIDPAARRNENVQVNRIDNDAIKEANVRLGSSVAIVSEPAAELGLYATENGRAAAEAPPYLRPVQAGNWHGELYEAHQNSVFNARTFFQVGGVKPSHRNVFGGRASGRAGALGSVTFTLNARRSRGMVNGNVLAPLAEERTPLATDPAIRAVVERFLAAYPPGLPNRLDFDPRALNTNAPERIDETDGELRWDRDTGATSRVSASYFLTRQRVDAFQLVAGQNPDTEIHGHRARLGWRREFSSASELALGISFNRTRSLLVSEPNAVGPRVRFGFQLQELGPDSMFPIDRAQNSFHYGGVARRLTGASRHALTFGAEVIRFQINGIESNNQRGYFQFTNNFGRTAIENLRLGTPSIYEVTVGELARGYRNLAANIFFGDKWKVSQTLDLYWGLRYGLVTSPTEVNGLDRFPYGCDCNNFSPRFAIAWRVGRDRVIRASYTVSFGDIQPVTYQQVRNNPPLVRYIQVQAPDLLEPLRGIDLNSPNVRTSPTVLSPDLVSPYAHQYNFTLEQKVAEGVLVRAGYVGSRSFKLLNGYVMNRAEPVPGIPLTTATIDQRRPDPRYYEVRDIVNGGIAYLDAAQAGLELRRAHGLTASATYTFGKALDEGADYSSTGANNDLNQNRNQWQYESRRDRKGLSLFDSTHAVQFFYAYELPRAAARGPAAWLANGWQISGITLLKTGTPLTLYIGSDAPGFGNVDGSPSERPNILDPSILGATISNPNTAPLILRRDRFSYISPGERRGNLGRGTFRKSPIANFNAALTKTWRFANGGERSIAVRGEAYNLTNHPQFDEPQRNLSAPPFGKITNTLNDGRVVQISVRVLL